jgi:two-component system OmpR family sensor kinase
MRSAERRWPFRDRQLDVAWGLFALANLVAMVAFPRWETVPFHFIWVSLTLVYGFRVWRTGGTVWTLGVVIALTGVVLAREVTLGSQPPDELTEVPLMACMFVAMVWHAQRRLAAMHEAQRVSDDNSRLLEREKRFVQDASHQLRTPIAIALGHAELIARESDRGAPASEDAHVVVEELERLRRIADLLLQIVGAEDAPSVNRTEVDADVLVVETLRRWMPTPRDWRVGTLPAAVALADADQLQMALDELIQNAVTHTRPGDRISLDVRSDRERVVIRIADEGTGIDPGEMDRIFDRFAQGGSDVDPGSRGLGLGLSFVKSMAESHGGGVSVESAPGHGSVFELWLPSIGVSTHPGDGHAADEVPAEAMAEAALPPDQEAAPVSGS